MPSLYSVVSFILYDLSSLRLYTIRYKLYWFSA